MRDVLLIQGDARHIPLEDESVQECVTSPPFLILYANTGPLNYH